MTSPDRPRAYRATRVHHEGGGETSFAKPRTLVEWDREKVVPLIETALRNHDGRVHTASEARAIFDALDPEG